MPFKSIYVDNILGVLANIIILKPQQITLNAWVDGIWQLGLVNGIGKLTWLQRMVSGAGIPNASQVNSTLLPSCPNWKKIGHFIKIVINVLSSEQLYLPVQVESDIEEDSKTLNIFNLYWLLIMEKLF